MIAAGAGWLLYAVGTSPHRSELVPYWGLAATVVTIAAGWISWAWRARAGTPGDAAKGPAADHIADVLARAVTGQWTRAAADRGLLAPEPIPVRWRRPAVPLAGPVAAATSARRFEPLPEMTLTTPRQLAGGDIGDLHQLYGGLGSGRLVIAGAPGSGKSGAAVLLILAALRHRDHVAGAERPSVPVPVMFTLHGWDPVAQPVQDWLAARLGQTYPLLAGRAGAVTSARLLAAGKIAVILDGLDEIPGELQPAALRALSHQAAFRLVILARTDEMAAAAAQSQLEGAAAVELQDVDAATAADYLTRVQLDPPPAGWSDLIRHLRHAPDTPLAGALGSPLTLTLVRDTYRDRDDVRELLDFCDSPASAVSRDDIIDHLLDRVLPAAYAQQPGQPPPRYDLPAARNALTRLAAQMNREGTRDLRWWTIPRWVTRVPRILLQALAVAALAALLELVGVALYPPEDWAAEIVFGLDSGLGTGLLFGLVLGLGIAVVRRHDAPRRMRPGRWHKPPRRDALGRGLVSGLVVGIGIGFLASGYSGHWPAGLAAGSASGLATALVVTFSGSGVDEASSVMPLTSWRNDLAFGLTIGLLAGFSIGLVSLWIQAVVPWIYHVASALGDGLAAALVVTLCSTKTWPAAVTFMQLAARWHTPPRLMRFLEDARHRNVLRSIGPAYQFRHARLQDRLAGAVRNVSPAANEDDRAGQTGKSPMTSS
ncbi:MAG TPA: hypothetical protein VLW44_09525 [Streptosporangiaceae bacterium]|nr:hypothetical protein [Streptosporangiaceae bacterium]